LIDHSEKRRWWPVLVPLALIGLAVSLLLPAARHQWALSLFRQPTNYTTLSFNMAWALPTNAVAGEPIPISFTVSNHEGRTINYRYVVTETVAGQSEVLKQSTRIVESDGMWTISIVIRPPRVGSQCRVQVSLPGRPETIDFLMTLTARRTAHG
jgi:hypothetical protein